MILLTILFIIHPCFPISILPSSISPVIPTSRGTSHCTLQPLGMGYYVSINLVNYTTASGCCGSKNLTLVQVDVGNNKVFRGVLVSGEFLPKTEPVGEHSSLWVNSVNSTGPLCTSAYLSSWRNPVLRTLETECGDLRSYVCYDKLFSGVDCSRIQYTEVQVDGGRVVGYSNVTLPWPDAYACCESRSQTLVRLYPSTTVSLLQHISRFGGTPLIWVGAYKSVDLALTREFKWVDNNDVSLLHNVQSFKSEICVAADLKSDFKNGLQPYACEERLNYVCGSEAPPPCDGIEWRSIRVNSTGRSYLYGVNARLSFNDAKSCCGGMVGYRVLSVVSVVTGDGLALALEKEPDTEGKVRGYGSVWVGAVKVSDGKYNYFGLDGSPNFTMRGYLRYLGGGGGDCLSFGVDVRLSFVLRGVGCGGVNGVVCERKVEYSNADMFVDVGNSYFYSRTAMSHEDANMSCRSNRMRLIEVGDEEEMRIVVDGVSQFQNHTSYLKGFWTGHKHYKIPLHDMPKSLTSYYVHQPWRARNLREMHHYVDEYWGVINDPPRCHESFWNVIGGDVVLEQWRRNCSKLLNFVCEVVVGGDEAGLGGEELIGVNSDVEVAAEWVDYGVCGGGGMDRGFVWISGGEVSWDQARECCSTLGNDREYELVSMDDVGMRVHLNEHANAGLYGMISGFGFWTSGRSVAGGFGWFGGNYSFVREDVFYNDGNEDVGESDVCLQAFYSDVDGGLRVVGKGCSEKSQYVCGRKFGLQEYPPCDLVLYERIGDSSYFISWDRMPWLRAADCCTQRSSELASITTKNESAYVARSLLSLLNFHNISDQGAWIGLVKPSHSTNFSWIDGTLFDFESYPHTHGYDDGDHIGHDGTVDKCVGVFTSGGHKGELVWKVLGCREMLWSVCRAGEDWFE